VFSEYVDLISVVLNEEKQWCVLKTLMKSSILYKCE